MVRARLIIVRSLVRIQAELLQFRSRMGFLRGGRRYGAAIHSVVRSSIGSFP
jgi:hypothetical protein